ncbi:MAG TPA: YggS family pyridoxal phosphate-dependent enzyme [Spirochaetota bacterium]|nr:YggS family pyridoxal phosphate-dependent enzyme [Spirochaetota bacterium]
MIGNAMTIAENYKIIKEKVAEAALKSNRDPQSIKILAVSKTFDASVVQEAIDSGITLFGENKVQEAKSKILQLAGNFEFHMIGHLQSNKARDAVKLFSLIHSVDKKSTAEKLDEEAGRIGKIQDILIQIKAFDEPSKSGINPEEALELAEHIVTLKNLRLKGVMNIGPLSEDLSDARKSFEMTRRTLEKINSRLSLSLSELSMGMSGDYPIAIEEGATIVRIGSAIFGNRSYIK